jgi:hypothetical protein
MVAAKEDLWVLTPYGMTGNEKLRVGTLATAPLAIASIIMVSTERGR